MSPSSKRLKSTFSSFSTTDDLALSGSNELMPPPSDAVSPFTSVTTILNEENPQKSDHCGDVPGTDTEHA